MYVQNAREDLVDNFVKAYEAAYTIDEHRSLNIQKVLKNLSLTRSLTDDSISASTNTDDNSIISSVSGKGPFTYYVITEEEGEGLGLITLHVIIV